MTATILHFPNMAKKIEDCPNRIREIRVAQGMSQAELAARIGTTPTHMSRFETGARVLTLEWLRRIAAVLRVTTAELLPPADTATMPTPREARLLQLLRAGGEGAMRTAEAVAETQSIYRAPPPDIGGAPRQDTDALDMQKPPRTAA